MSPEAAHLKVASMIELGILKQIESAWKMHLEVGDYLKLEELPAAADESTMDLELADFDKRADLSRLHKVLRPPAVQSVG